jgi:hypothetical protein
MGLKATLSSEDIFGPIQKHLDRSKMFLDLKMDKALIETYLGIETKSFEENSNTG